MTHDTTHDIEGISKFALDFRPGASPDWRLCAELDAWRCLLFKLGLTGQDPDRYGGLAYGNVSRRLDGNAFLISGTQTGAWPILRAEHYCVVDACAPDRNHITAHGPIRPSSETLTHGAAYLAASHIHAVLHVHSPLLWTHAAALGIAVTETAIAYGTPAMARAVARLLSGAESCVIAMGGHQDGLMACGTTIETAALSLLRWLGMAIQLNAVQRGAESPGLTSADAPPQAVPGY